MDKSEEPDRIKEYHASSTPFLTRKKEKKRNPNTFLGGVNVEIYLLKGYFAT